MASDGEDSVDSVDESTDSESQGSSGPVLTGDFFKSKKKKSNRQPKDANHVPATVPAKDASPDESSPAVTPVAGAFTSEALGSFFTARHKKKPKRSEASNSSADQTPSAATNRRRSLQEWNEFHGGKQMPPEEEEEDTSQQTIVASRASSRAAWKSRGAASAEESPQAKRQSSTCSSMESSSCESKAPQKKKTTTEKKDKKIKNDGKDQLGKKTAGMYRPARQTASDSTRCHWLIQPESLLIRVDPETGEFLQRQWLAIAQMGRSNVGSSSSGQPPRDKRKFPARLHAGWLAQMLRPKGWLASIPEDEARDFPMPPDLVSEPDRGKKKPSMSAVKAIMEELVKDSEDSSDDGSGDHAKSDDSRDNDENAAPNSSQGPEDAW